MSNLMKRKYAKPQSSEAKAHIEGVENRRDAYFPNVEINEEGTVAMYRRVWLRPIGPRIA